MMFEEVYTLFGLYPERDELFMTFRKYNAKKDDLLKYSDIVDIFAPRDERYKDILVRRKSFNTGRCF
jgi:hypothetical protein